MQATAIQTHTLARISFACLTTLFLLACMGHQEVAQTEPTPPSTPTQPTPTATPIPAQALTPTPPPTPPLPLTPTPKANSIPTATPTPTPTTTLPPLTQSPTPSPAVAPPPSPAAIPTPTPSSTLSPTPTTTPIPSPTPTVASTPTPSPILGPEIEAEATIASCSFYLEVADDSTERARGLMGRESLGKDRGMLFVFQSEQTLSFWMRNTLIPLDILFIDEDLTVVDVQSMRPEHEAAGDSPPIHTSAAPALYAIEINEGIAAECGIEPGASVVLREITP